MKKSLPVWSLGFRPFFLLGPLYGIFLIVFWTFYQSGLIAWQPGLSSVIWHAHEMLFGFTTAIIAGFILTASQNWSNKRGVHGRSLMLLVGLWALPRVLSFFPSLTFLFSFTDLLFYPVLAWFLIPYLGGEQQKRNKIFFVFFLLMFVSNLLIHLSHWEFGTWARQGYYLALHTVVAMVVLIGGRVIPFFTERGVQGATPYRFNWTEKLSISSVLVFALVQFVSHHPIILATVSAFAFGVHLLRWLGWKPHQSLSTPIVAILHIGYLWIPIGFLLYALAALEYFPINLAAHAFGLGALGIVIYGMVNRVSLGHTGRIIHASPPLVFGYLCMILAALIRVLLAGLLPEHTMVSIKIAGALWIIAFSILFVYNLPILLSGRPDGRDG